VSEMKRAPLHLDVQPNAIIYTLLVDVCSAAGQHDRAWALWKSVFRTAQFEQRAEAATEAAAAAADARAGAADAGGASSVDFFDTDTAAGMASRAGGDSSSSSSNNNNSSSNNNNNSSSSGSASGGGDEHLLVPDGAAFTAGIVALAGKQETCGLAPHLLREAEKKFNEAASTVTDDPATNPFGRVSKKVVRSTLKDLSPSVAAYRAVSEWLSG
jgi:hypothetical protein